MPHHDDKPALSITGLRYRYPRATEDVIAIGSLRLEPGEQAVLSGRSGSGKSTLLHLIAGLMDPVGGRVLIGGVDIHALSGPKRDRFRGRTIGMVFQNHQLLHGFTVLENVLAALMFSRIPRATHHERALLLLGSLGINTPSARIDELSIGQQQRVAVARAVACSPALVLADEPTAALDPGYAAAAMDMLQDACRTINAALLCVTHDLSLIDRFDRHDRLEDQAAGTGSPASGSVPSPGTGEVV
ncbi:MAG: ABC transporter ATP-binding protein [Phycisphaerales bacterium]